MEFESVVATITRAIEVTGIGVLLVGGIVASGAFLVRASRRQDFTSAYKAYRSDLGRAILLGLEFLVAADIVNTVAIEPTFRRLGVLGLIVLIRTFLSFALEVEINGRWPWQGRDDQARR